MKTINLIKTQYLRAENLRDKTQPDPNVSHQVLTLSTKILISLGTIGLLFTGTTTTAYSQTAKSSLNDSRLLEQINRYSVPKNDDALGQVNNISQLRDVSPTDWSYEALRGLVDRYGCIAGFPDQTFRGNQPLSRYEFAAGLNSCLNQIERLIASMETVSAEDLATVRRLTQEFEAELAALNERVDDIEERTASLEDDQFSATTKLTGEAVLSLGNIFNGDNASGQEIDSEPVYGARARLGFNTSFTGKDLLFTQFTAGNFPFFSETTGTFEGDLGLIADNGNDLNLLVALYSFPLSDRTTVVLEGSGGIAFDFADTISPLDHFRRWG